MLLGEVGFLDALARLLAVLLGGAIEAIIVPTALLQLVDGVELAVDRAHQVLLVNFKHSFGLIVFLLRHVIKLLPIEGKRKGLIFLELLFVDEASVGLFAPDGPAQIQRHLQVSRIRVDSAGLSVNLDLTVHLVKVWLCKRHLVGGHRSLCVDRRVDSVLLCNLKGLELVH